MASNLYGNDNNKSNPYGNNGGKQSNNKKDPYANGYDPYASGSNPYANPYSQPQNKPNPYAKQGNQIKGPEVAKGNGPNLDQLKRLQAQLNSRKQKQVDEGTKKTILIILLLLLIIIIITTAVLMFSQRSGINEDFKLRLSTTVTNTDKLTVTSPNGTVSAREIYPADSYDISSIIRNSNSIIGDTEEVEVSAIYVRFKIDLIVDGKAYNDIVIPEIINTRWHTYNEYEEPEDSKNDHYYYYYGKLNYNEGLTLFTAITFHNLNLTNVLGAKKGMINIVIEVVEADLINVGSGAAWGTAPTKWLANMKLGINNQGQPIEV